MPSFRASLAPGRPARATPIAVNALRNGGLYRECGLVRAGDLLDERDPSAPGPAAEYAAHEQPDHDRPPGQGGVGQPPVIAAVHPPRLDAAVRAGDPIAPRPGLDHDSAVDRVDPFDRDLRQMRQQPLKIAPRSATTVHIGRQATRQRRPTTRSSPEPNYVSADSSKQVSPRLIPEQLSDPGFDVN